MKFATRLLTFNPAPGDRFTPANTPIYQTATFRQDDATEFGEYDYSRSGNPTRAVVEKQIASLESGSRGFCFATGLAAITAVTRLVSPGEEILACDDLYGGAYRLFSRILAKRGINVRYVDFSNLDAVAAAITPNTKLVYLETPTNPLLQIIDIAAAADIAHRNGLLLCVDNSTMSPYLQRPLELGADIVLHSATKFLCGHSDVMAGAIVVNDEEIGNELYLIQNGEGAALSPFDSFLLLRGSKTLALRLDRQQSNAKKIAELAQRPSEPSIASTIPASPMSRSFAFIAPRLRVTARCSASLPAIRSSRAQSLKRRNSSTSRSASAESTPPSACPTICRTPASRRICASRRAFLLTWCEFQWAWKMWMI